MQSFSLLNIGSALDLIHCKLPKFWRLSEAPHALHNASKAEVSRTVVQTSFFRKFNQFLRECFQAYSTFADFLSLNFHNTPQAELLHVISGGNTKCNMVVDVREELEDS